MKKYLYFLLLSSFINIKLQAQTTINLAPCSNCLDTAFLINDTTLFVSGDTIRIKSVLTNINMLIESGNKIKGKNLSPLNSFIIVNGGDSSVMRNVSIGINASILRDSVVRWMTDSIGTILPAQYKWFYMPSISINTTSTGTGLTRDLYNLYKSEFLSPAVKSAGAPAAIPYFTSPSMLYYYVTSFDPTVFANISIDANGVMTYDVISNATDCSVINIVFAIK
jgi:hypothetical protein